MAHILLVEDDPNLTDLYGGALRAAGHTVVVASNGQEALDRVGQERPGVILMDIQMPVMDGIEATSRLKASRHREIPIVALTNLQLPAEVSAALDAGCDGYITKPANPDDLVDELSLVLGAGDDDDE